jgi:hypothetical protein
VLKPYKKEINGKMNDNWQKIISIISFILLTTALIIAHTHPVTGYELDIYAKTPIVTWIFILLAMLGGSSIIISAVVNRNSENRQIWILGLLLLVMSAFSFLCVPYVRNYFSWYGDNMSHWGLIEDILNTGHFTTLNFYPITHCLVSEIILITNGRFQVIANLSTPFLSVLFIISTYLLTTVVLANKKQQLIATALAALVFFEGDYQVFLMPNGWSILMLPLVLYCYFKSQSNRSYILPFISLLIIYPFFHPLSSLMLAIMLISIFLIGRIIKSLLNNRKQLTTIKISYWSLVFGVIELGILMFWVTSFELFRMDLKNMVASLFSAGSEVMGTMGNTLGKINIHGFDLGVLYLKLYGADTILIILSLLGLILIFRQIKKHNEDSFPFFIVDIGVFFLIFGFIYLLYLGGMLGLSNISAERMISYIMIFTPELGAVTIFWIIRKLRYNVFKYISLAALLLIPSGLSLRALYDSPYVVQPNSQITTQDIAGFNWTIMEKDLGIGILYISNEPTRYFDLILGSKAANERVDYNDSAQFLDHFGYQEYLNVGEQYSEDNYAVITETDELIYSSVWKVVGRFNDSDFNKLQNDSTVSQIYSNGDTAVLYIYGIKNVDH